MNMNAPWLESVGLLDSLTQTHEPSKAISWVDRYGRLHKGYEYVFELPDFETGPHDAFVVTDASIGVQRAGYNTSTGRFNEITYVPAYGYGRIASGLLLAKTIVSTDSERAIPLRQQHFKSLTPDDVIEDVRHYMSESGN